MNELVAEHDDLIQKTVGLWKQEFCQTISISDAEEIIRNLTGLVNLLIELEEKHASN